MQLKFNVGEYTIQTETQYTNDILNENKIFPILTIGKDSYIEEAFAQCVFDKNLIYNFQIGRYSSIAANVTFLIDMNHDYKRVCQGRINGIPYLRPTLTKRKGQIIIMNDCWVGDGATILSGVTIGNGAVVAAEAVVTKDVPPYAIAAGNPAKIIGYRFEKAQIEALNLIRWWNWSNDRIKANATELQGDIDHFIQRHISEAKQELSNIVPADIKPIEKKHSGEERILLYIPDFEQDYPTWPQVIEAFIQSYSNTNHELLLYIEEDNLLDEKLALLDQIFSKYEDAECYINLYIGNVEDMRSLFCQVDAYITNRSKENVSCMDMADLFGLPTISSVDLPIFKETTVLHMVKEKSESQSNSLKPDTIKTMMEAIRALDSTQDNIQNVLSQISQNQMALDCSINNAKYEILDGKEPIYPIIEPIENTIHAIIKEGKSICRFGDGEFSLIAGEHRHRFQAPSPKLAERLLEVLQSNQDNILVCISDMYGDLSKYTAAGKLGIRMYLTEDVRRQQYALLDMNRHYHDTHITRPYAIYADNNTSAPKKRFEALKQIWEKRSLLIIEGEKTRLGIGNDLFNNAADIIRILGPAESAFDRYDDILTEAHKYGKDRLILIAMGATATVLAYDLACAGFQALDIGHIDIEYEWMKAGKGGRVPIKNKYVNELQGGNIVEDIQDPVYESQIVAKFL